MLNSDTAELAIQKTSGGVAAELAHSKDEPLPPVQTTSPAMPEAEGRAEYIAKAVFLPLEESRRLEGKSQPEELGHTGVLWADEQPGAASSSPGADDAAPEANSTPQAQTYALGGSEGHTGASSKRWPKSKSKADKKTETIILKEMDAEGQKLLDAWEVFQENAQDRLHYFE